MYGLGANALDCDAIERVYRIKQRPPGKPLSILIPHRQDLAKWAAGITADTAYLLERLWPGRVTFVFQAKTTLPQELLGGTGRIGIRLPAHRVARALVKAFGRPLTATSANLSGRPACVRVGDLPPQMLEQLDLVLDAGALPGGSGSTVVDLTGDAPLILREGVVSAAEIRSVWQARPT
jgi:L-threonylcarbamoyladenylate synthase